MEVQNMLGQTELRLHSTISLLLDGDDYLVLQRSDEDSYNPGLWEFPGGKVEKFIDLRKEGMREVHEEFCGSYRIVNYGFIGEIRTPALKPKYKGYEIAFYVFLGGLDFSPARSENELHSGNEYQAYAFLSIAEIRKLNITPETKMVLEEFKKLLE